MAKKRINISIDDATRERLVEYGLEHHIQGGVSGAIEYIAWNEIKVKNTQIRGQMTINDMKT